MVDGPGINLLPEEGPAPNGNGHNGEVPPGDLRVLGDILVDRMLFMRQARITFGGDRDLYEAFGYDRVITAKMYRDRYARGGIAGRIIDALPNATWRGDVELIEDENPDVSTEFEKAWDTLETRLKVTSTLCRVDKLSRLSTYAILLIGTAAGGDLTAELPKGGKPDQIIFLSPFPGGGGPGLTEKAGVTGDMSSAYVDATISELETDPKSPRFGLPRFYRLRRLDAVNVDFQKPVHWSRVIHVAENCLDNEVYGQPALERCWNLLDDLDKVTGGGAEAFYLRANPGLHANVDKDMKLADAKDDLANLANQIDRWRHKMSDRAFRTKGVDIQMLASDVANFSLPADAILTQIAGATSMPKRILTGSEMGELASSQDRDNWKDQVNGRQTGHAGPNIIRQLVDRLITYGYLPKPAQYEVRWAHIQTMTEQEKADGAAKWAQVNSTAGFVVFSDAEIREHWYDMEPSEEEDTDSWRTDLALKMATTNKTEGSVIFTDDEIRDVCFGWKPLTPEQKVPITAPERVSATAPTPEVDAEGKPIAAAPQKGAPAPFQRAAEDVEMLRVLEAAILENNTDVIDSIIGIRHAGGEGSGNFGHEGRPGEIGGSGGGDHVDPSGVQHFHVPVSIRAKNTYLREYQANKTLETRLSGTQATKLHTALMQVRDALSDPETGHLVYQALSSGTEGIEERIDALVSGMASYIGGKGQPPPGYLYKDRAKSPIENQNRKGFKAASDASVLSALEELQALLKNKDTRDFMLWLLDRVRDAGSIEALDAKLGLRTAGGAGSGNFGHEGRPGEIGGSDGGTGRDRPFSPSIQAQHQINQPSSAYTPLNNAGKDSEARFSDGKEHYTPERQALHEAIISQHFEGKTPVANPQSILFGGGSASGKSTIKQTERLGAVNTVNVDSDEIKKMLPEYNDMIAKNDPNAGSFAHEESSYLSKQITARAVDGNYNVLFDGTGDNSLQSLEKKAVGLRKGGQEIIAHYATSPVDTAIARAEIRGQKTGRFTPATVVRETHKSVSNILPQAIERGLFDRLTVHDTTIDGSSRIIATAVGKKLTIHDQKAWDAFLAKGK